MIACTFTSLAICGGVAPLMLLDVLVLWSSSRYFQGPIARLHCLIDYGQ